MMQIYDKVKKKK